jgi:hypothetical protein
MEVIEPDYLTIFIAAILYMICGAIWYNSSLFGKKWIKLNKAKGKKGTPFFLFGFLNALVTSFFLSILIAYLGATSTLDGIYAALGVWLGFVVTTQLPSYLWSSRPWESFFIDIGFYFIGFGVMGAILGA